MRLLFLITPIILSGCFGPEAPKPPKPTLKQIKIITGNEINENLAVSVDFIQIYSKNLFGILKKMNAAEFQKQKSQLYFNHPNQFKIWSVEAIPNQISKCYQFPDKPPYWGMIAFVHFFNKESNRLVFSTKQSCLGLSLEKQKIKIINQSASDKCTILKGI